MAYRAYAARLVRLPAKVYKSVLTRGAVVTFQMCVTRLAIHLKHLSPTQFRIDRSEATFDQLYKVDTAAGNALSEQNIPFATRADAVHYQPTNPFVFRSMMMALPIKYEEFTFVDIGAGKGRILLLASHYGFKEIIGIEFDRELHRIAIENIRTRDSLPGCRSVLKCLHEDATRWRPSAAKMVLYLFNPFGAASLTSMLDNLSASMLAGLVEEAYVLYLNPVHEDVLRHNKRFQRVYRSDRLSFVVYAAGPATAPAKYFYASRTRVSDLAAR